jgi:hypothetical protein
VCRVSGMAKRPCLFPCARCSRRRLLRAALKNECDSICRAEFLTTDGPNPSTSNLKNRGPRPAPNHPDEHRTAVVGPYKCHQLMLTCGVKSSRCLASHFVDQHSAAVGPRPGRSRGRMSALGSAHCCQITRTVEAETGRVIFILTVQHRIFLLCTAMQRRGGRGGAGRGRGVTSEYNNSRVAGTSRRFTSCAQRQRLCLSS